MAKQETPLTPEQKLDLIVHYLDRMNRRDRLRTIGGFFGGILRMASLVFFLWTSWYAVTHFDEIMSKMTQQAADAVSGSARDGAGGIINSLDDDQFDALFQRASEFVNRSSSSSTRSVNGR